VYVSAVIESFRCPTKRATSAHERPVQERDSPVSEVVRREERHAGGLARLRDRGAERAGPLPANSRASASRNRRCGSVTLSASASTSGRSTYRAARVLVMPRTSRARSRSSSAAHRWRTLCRSWRRTGVSRREIARRLGMNRRTVARLIASDEPPRYRRAPAGSQLDRLEPVLRRLLSEWPAIKAPRVTEILCCEYGYT
jgi:hypothetical protein